MRSFITALLSSLILSACTSQQTSPINSTLILRDIFSQESSSFVQGENIEFYLTATNSSESAVTVDFTSSQQYDFTVESTNGSKIWRRSDGKVFAPSLSSITFQPGESKIFSVTWNQILSNAHNIAIGSYVAKGSLLNNSSISEYNFEIQ